MEYADKKPAKGSGTLRLDGGDMLLSLRGIQRYSREHHTLQYIKSCVTDTYIYDFLLSTHSLHANVSSDNLGTVGPANQTGCIILCAGNLADEKFYAFNEVSRMKFLGTVVHRLTELLPNHWQHRRNLYHNYIFK
jgi:hypothetical protein